MEKWKEIEGYPDYMVSDKGNIMSLKHGKTKLLKLKTNSFNYHTVGLFANNKRKSFLVHRLVACAFIHNPKNKPCINHKDGNKKNNCVSNIEWCTNKENNFHRYRVLGQKNALLGKTGDKCVLSKKIYQINKDTNEIIAVFSGAHEAARIINGHSSNISSCASGRLKTANGYKWRWVL